MAGWKGNRHGIFVTLGASNHTDQERESNDYYATDPMAIDALEGALEGIPHKVWEPACGENTNEREAYIEWCDYLYTLNKTKFKEQEPLRVWRFDTAGPCVYGEAIVVAKYKEDAVRTFTQYAKKTDKDMLHNFSLEPTEEEELSTPLKEAKVITAWYDIC